ncbi:thiamine biosynthesis lipoprotein [Pedobacter psychrotolerans]|uniref:FAD:protein FMN transferase n=1 Tax=Pedobacter psychrotolerans TaxID=1843235 RepID=A0A4R2HMI2_9SPHI|nr:FAD:protein FMN transferase [Pedobacter psychrotolerans]TCO31143.1 thiamine biosynthesis lipoprotein [Pedobacter psychrotolerans]GGE41932.1 FAD:protein FMN transferase [Pedobacter psychrotolerans]
MPTPVSVHRQLKLMGNRFEFTVIAESEQEGNIAIDAAIAEVKRIEDLLTTFSNTSQTYQINEFAGLQSVKVSNEIIGLIERANRISEITDGAFDISYGSIDKRLWNFDPHMTELPDQETALKAVRLINYRNVILDKANTTVFLKNKGMRIGFGGIGKGYAADKAKQVLQQKGIKSGIVNAAGDLITWGTQANGQPWTVGIADPEQTNRPFSSLKISDMAIATSGSYEKNVTINGKRYSHTIDPKTGLPVTGVKSVSIICPSAELADALATPVIVMGVKVGLELINQIKHVACIIIDDDDQVFTSDNINII